MDSQLDINTAGSNSQINTRRSNNQMNTRRSINQLEIRESVDIGRRDSIKRHSRTAEESRECVY